MLILLVISALFHLITCVENENYKVENFTEVKYEIPYTVVNTNDSCVCWGYGSNMLNLCRLPCFVNIKRNGKDFYVDPFKEKATNLSKIYTNSKSTGLLIVTQWTVCYWQCTKKCERKCPTKDHLAYIKKWEDLTKKGMRTAYASKYTFFENCSRLTYSTIMNPYLSASYILTNQLYGVIRCYSNHDLTTGKNAKKKLTYYFKVSSDGTPDSPFILPAKRKGKWYEFEKKPIDYFHVMMEKAADKISSTNHDETYDVTFFDTINNPSCTASLAIDVCSNQVEEPKGTVNWIDGIKHVLPENSFVFENEVYTKGMLAIWPAGCNNDCSLNIETTSCTNKCTSKTIKSGSEDNKDEGGLEGLGDDWTKSIKSNKTLSYIIIVFAVIVLLIILLIILKICTSIMR